MGHKVIVALDGSEGAWRAVEYVAQIFGPIPGAEVILLHILSGLPPALWDDGHILDERERESRQRLKASWQADQEKQWKGLVLRACHTLEAAGIPQSRVAGKFKPKYFDVAEDIVKEATSGGAGTIVMGRRGMGTARGLLLGSVSQKVVQNARGCAVIIVG